MRGWPYLSNEPSKKNINLVWLIQNGVVFLNEFYTHASCYKLLAPTVALYQQHPNHTTQISWPFINDSLFMTHLHFFRLVWKKLLMVLLAIQVHFLQLDLEVAQQLLLLPHKWLNMEREHLELMKSILYCQQLRLHGHQLLPFQNVQNMNSLQLRKCVICGAEEPSENSIQYFALQDN